jgi:hypothetical protein
MGQNELATKGLAALLYNHKCPVGCRCMANDCVKCLQLYMEKGGQHGKE